MTVSIVYVYYQDLSGRDQRKEMVRVCKTEAKARECIIHYAKGLASRTYLGFENQEVEE